MSVTGGCFFERNEPKKCLKISKKCRKLAEPKTVAPVSEGGMHHSGRVVQCLEVKDRPSSSDGGSPRSGNIQENNGTAGSPMLLTRPLGNGISSVECPVRAGGASVLPPPLNFHKYQRSRAHSDREDVFSIVKKECTEIQLLNSVEEPTHENYEVLEVAGVGVGGLVMKVRCLKTNTILARKSAPINWSESSTASSPIILYRESSERSWAESATREIKILKKLDSPYIVKFKGAYVYERELFTLMEYVDMGNLKFISNMVGPIYEPDLSKIGVQILKGLDYLSKMLVIHRDIKPSNILMSKSGQIKLADFGISANLMANSDASPCIGSHGYLAPELIYSGAFNMDAPSGNNLKRYGSLSPPSTPDMQPSFLQCGLSSSEELSQKPTLPHHHHLAFCSDIWSFGIVLLELAMGRYPYPNFHTKIELFACIYQEDPPILPDNVFSAGLIRIISAWLVLAQE